MRGGREGSASRNIFFRHCSEMNKSGKQHALHCAFRLSACALAVASALDAQAQTVNQSLYSSGPTTWYYDGTTIAPATGNVDIGVTNRPVDVTVYSPGVTINGNLTLGNVVVNSSTVFRVNESRNTVTGLLSTEGQALRFTIAPNVSVPVSNANYLNVKDGVGSGKINTQSMFMGSTETFNTHLTGSLKNGATYHLIESVTDIGSSSAKPDFNDVTSQGTSNCQTCKITDNSYVITSHLYAEDATPGSGRYITYQATRTADVYVTASYTQGHFSNNAAKTLGNIAMNGYQQGDLVNAISTLDLDDYGFGDTKDHLAVQVQRLAPIANNSYIRSAYTISDVMNSIVENRLYSLRQKSPGQAKGDEQQRAWIRLFSNVAKQSGVDDYDGYRLGTNGMMVGFDHNFAGTWVGATASFAASSLRQVGFRNGDRSIIHSHEVNLYATRDFGPLYVNGMAGLGHHAYNGSRQSAIDRVAHDQFQVNESFLKLGVGYRFRLNDPRTVITPYLDVTSSRMHQPEYTETDAGDFGLNYDDKNFNRVRTVAGVRYQTESRIFSLPTFTTLHIGVGNDSGLNNLDVTARYSGSTSRDYTSFTTPVASYDRHLLNLGGGVTLGLNKTTSVQLNAEMEHRRSYNSAGVHAKATWVF